MPAYATARRPTPPCFYHRPACTSHRIGLRQRHGGDAAADGGGILGTLAHQVGALAGRIGADDQKVGRAGKALVADPGRDQHRVAGLRPNGGTTLPAEAHLGRAGSDAQNFVGGRVVVVEGKDAVSPAMAPAVAVKQILEGARRIAGRHVDGAGIVDQRQAAVGDVAIVGEMVKRDLRSHRTGSFAVDHPAPPLSTCHSIGSTPKDHVKPALANVAARSTGHRHRFIAW